MSNTIRGCNLSFQKQKKSNIREGYVEIGPEMARNSNNPQKTK